MEKDLKVKVTVIKDSDHYYVVRLGILDTFAIIKYHSTSWVLTDNEFNSAQFITGDSFDEVYDKLIKKLSNE